MCSFISQAVERDPDHAGDENRPKSNNGRPASRLAGLAPHVEVLHVGHGDAHGIHIYQHHPDLYARGV